MVELNVTDKNITKELICTNSCFSYLSVLEGNTLGTVWVDSIEQPTFSLIWNEYLQSFQFMGQPLPEKEYQDFRNFLETTVTNYLSGKDINYFEYASDSEDVLRMLAHIFVDKKIDAEWQYNYEVKHPILRCNCEEKFSLIKIDDAFFDKQYSNMDYVLEDIAATWGSKERFLECSTGYVAIYKDEIISRAIANAQYDNTYVIGVDTLEAYRQKGLSSSLLALLLQDSTTNNYKIAWDCMESNIASQKTAVKCGLVFESKYKICWFQL